MHCDMSTLYRHRRRGPLETMKLLALAVRWNLGTKQPVATTLCASVFYGTVDSMHIAGPFNPATSGRAAAAAAAAGTRDVCRSKFDLFGSALWCVSTPFSALKCAAGCWQWLRPATRSAVRGIPLRNRVTRSLEVSGLAVTPTHGACFSACVAACSANPFVPCAMKLVL